MLSEVDNTWEAACNLKKFAIYFLACVGLAIGLFWLFITYNIAGTADLYYGYKYLRPYARLERDTFHGQFLKLNDNRILYMGNKRSSIFDPKTKAVHPAPSWLSAGIWVDSTTPQLLEFQNGKILAIPSTDTYKFHCQDQEDERIECPKGKIPLLDLKKHKISWMSFPFLSLQEYSVTVLTNGKLLVIGGRYPEVKTEVLNSPQGDKYTFKKTVYRDNKNITIFDPIALQRKTIGQLQQARNNPFTLVLNDREALALGGITYVSTGTQAKLSVEKINLRTGVTEISPQKLPFHIGGSFSISASDYVLLDKERIFIPGSGSYTSAIVNVQHPEKSMIWSEIKSPEFETRACVILNDKRGLCHSEFVIRLVDPFKMNISRIRTKMTSQSTVMNIPEVGILYMGAKANQSVLDDKTEETIYLLNLDKTLRTLETKELSKK